MFYRDDVLGCAFLSQSAEAAALVGRALRALVVMSLLLLSGCADLPDTSLLPADVVADEGSAPSGGDDTGAVTPGDDAVQPQPDTWTEPVPGAAATVTVSFVSFGGQVAGAGYQLDLVGTPAAALDGETAGGLTAWLGAGIEWLGW